MCKTVPYVQGKVGDVGMTLYNCFLVAFSKKYEMVHCHFMCQEANWNSTTTICESFIDLGVSVCASVYSLVAVSLDR